MSIRGIDAQIMMARTADAAREASNQMKGSEKMHESLAIQAKETFELEKSSIPKTEETPSSALHLKNEHEGAGGEYDGSGGKREKSEYDELLDADAGPGQSTIDITL